MAVISTEYKFKITYQSHNSEIPIGFVVYDPNHIIFPTTFGVTTVHCILQDGDNTCSVDWGGVDRCTDTSAVFYGYCGNIFEAEQISTSGIKVAPLYLSELIKMAPASN